MLGAASRRQGKRPGGARREFTSTGRQTIFLQPSGAVGSTYNFAAPLYLNMIHAYEQGDIQHAQKLQRKVREMIKLLHRYDGLVGGKAIMKIMGMD